MILAESATEEKNVLTKETLDAVWTLDAKVKNLEVCSPLFYSSKSHTFFVCLGISKALPSLMLV